MAAWDAGDEHPDEERLALALAKTQPGPHDAQLLAVLRDHQVPLDHTNPMGTPDWMEVLLRVLQRNDRAWHPSTPLPPPLLEADRALLEHLLPAVDLCQQDEREGHGQCTALHHAVRFQHPEVFELLVRHGAAPDQPDLNGTTVVEAIHAEEWHQQGRDNWWPGRRIPPTEAVQEALAEGYRQAMKGWLGLEEAGADALTTTPRRLRL